MSTAPLPATPILPAREPETVSTLWQTLVSWTPVTLIICGTAYYALGFLYWVGIMAYLDTLAIAFLGNLVGYVGIGYYMPLFQFYSAWIMRILLGIVAGFAYNLVARCVTWVITSLQTSAEGQTDHPSSRISLATPL